MFFFFVGGVNQQVRQVLKSGAGRCINCGSRADLVEYEKVLKLFFVPVWRWPAKDPAMYCNNCNLFFPPEFSTTRPRESLPPPPPDALRCRFCDRDVEPEFSFCPYCGSAL
ncbi:Large-conductance mechanosensitive channel like [Melia azedarach]|uniref:Large-conductance mechanosensitive channel like n=1 Tax=Melia azedarach TaxID=155640 RepID=A0ACC1WP68_MELAZ|nr:Large-conductance mechanosensitive channel like [Melia azedarach]